MNVKIRRQLAARKRSIKRRLDKTKLGRECPVLSASNIRYEIADRTRAIPAGGMGMIHLMVKRLELDQAINRRLGVFKIYLPYSESDHVLNVAYNLLAGGTCLEHLERLEIVRELTGQQRNRLFSYTQYIDIMNQGTEVPD